VATEETGKLPGAAPTIATAPAVTIGVIGTGNMGSALVRGWSRRSAAGSVAGSVAGSAERVRLLVWDKIPAATQRVAGCEGVEIAGSPAALVSEATVVLIVVKPKDAAEALAAVAPLFRAGHIVVSAMAGVELEQIRKMCGPAPAVFRVMPNLGVEVGAGTVAVAAEQDVPTEARELVVELFAALGLTALVPEGMMDAVTAVSGTGPALLAIAVEGLEDGGVAAGLPRTMARMFARRAMLGAARTLLTDSRAEQPAAALREQLAPAGDPLAEGVESIEERGVRSAFQSAVEAASARARSMRGPSSPKA
jgi:pyrroline-5-carboxylate reductase